LPTEIYNWFTEGFDTADLTDAKALLDELASEGNSVFSIAADRFGQRRKCQN
jgi:hypothetical protein